jgi:hypothetical protein
MSKATIISGALFTWHPPLKESSLISHRLSLLDDSFVIIKKRRQRMFTGTKLKVAMQQLVAAASTLGVIF